MGSAEERHGASPNGGGRSTCGPIYHFQERHNKKRMKTYDNDGHHFVTGQWHSGSLHKMLEMAEEIPKRIPQPRRRTDKMLQSNLAAITLEISEGGASGMEHSSTRHGAQPTATATNRPDRPTGLCHNRVSGPTGRSPLPFPSPPTKAG